MPASQHLGIERPTAGAEYDEEMEVWDAAFLAHSADPIVVLPWQANAAVRVAYAHVFGDGTLDTANSLGIVDFEKTPNTWGVLFPGRLYAEERSRKGRSKRD